MGDGEPSTVLRIEEVDTDTILLQLADLDVPHAIPYLGDVPADHV